MQAEENEIYSRVGATNQRVKEQQTEIEALRQEKEEEIKSLRKQFAEEMQKKK